MVCANTILKNSVIERLNIFLVYTCYQTIRYPQRWFKEIDRYSDVHCSLTAAFKSENFYKVKPYTKIFRFVIVKNEKYNVEKKEWHCLRRQEKHSGFTRYCVGKAQEGVGVSVFAKIPPPAATTAIMRCYRVASIILYGCTLQPSPATLLLQPLTFGFNIIYRY